MNKGRILNTIIGNFEGNVAFFREIQLGDDEENTKTFRYSFDIYYITIIFNL